MKKRLITISFLSTILSVLIAGCAVGPDFRTPEFKTPERYTASALPAETAGAPTEGGKVQRFAFAEDLSAQWWVLFRSPELDALIKKGLAESPSLAAAQAALRVARENLTATRGGLLFPSIDAGAGASRQRISADSDAGTSSIFSLYNASVNVSYTLDLFGGSRRRIEALEALVDYRNYQFEATYLTLTANIVTTAVQEAALRGEIAATRDILSAQERQLEIVKRQFELGAVPKISVLAQQTELAITKATLPPLEKQLSYTRHALSVLVGQMPGEGNLAEFRLDSLHLPEALPVSLPSVLARQRPDIRASEAILHQASAEVGVATANLYPRITLSGSYGTQAITTGFLFSGESIAWSIGAGLLQPLFHGGELTAKRRAAIAAYDQAAAQYRQTVLKAFQEVADVLRALETDAQALQAHAEAEGAAKATLEMAEKQFRLGAVNYLYLLVAQRNYERTRVTLIAAQALRYADTAALFQALGGGWWNRTAETTDKTSKQNTD
jgi:NodT family efflux transporter outer membrane factor (OMF) lipoprotein